MNIHVNHGTVNGATNSRALIKGVISKGTSLKGTISGSNVLVGCLSVPEGYTDYIEEYVVQPSAQQQILDTSDKHMTKDVIIEAIPYAEVSNNSDGITVTIG